MTCTASVALVQETFRAGEDAVGAKEMEEEALDALVTVEESAGARSAEKFPNLPLASVGDPATTITVKVREAFKRVLLLLLLLLLLAQAVMLKTYVVPGWRQQEVSDNSPEVALRVKGPRGPPSGGLPVGAKVKV